MQIELEARPSYGMAVVTLDKGETVIAESGAMVAMSSGLSVDTTFNGVDWIALRDELRPTVEKATATDQLRAVIEEMLDRLDQSHFALIPSEVADTLDPSEGDPSIEVGDVGMDSRFIGAQLVVTKVDPLIS